MKPVWTIGYERSTLSAVIDALTSAGVELLIDVRAVAASRRPGFSKTILANSLVEAGVDYLHLRDLGTPKAGRDAARSGRHDDMRRIFAAHLEEPAAVAALARLADEVQARRACLLCYEADAASCHREVLAQRLAAISPRPIVHLRADFRGDASLKVQDSGRGHRSPEVVR